MNCKKGDLAFIKAPAPWDIDNGIIIEVLEFEGIVTGLAAWWVLSKGSPLHCGLSGERRCDKAIVADIYLVPLRGDLSGDETETTFSNPIKGVEYV